MVGDFPMDDLHQLFLHFRGGHNTLLMALIEETPKPHPLGLSSLSLESFVAFAASASSASFFTLSRHSWSSSPKVLPVISLLASSIVLPWPSRRIQRLRPLSPNRLVKSRT